MDKFYSIELGGVPIGGDCCGFDDMKPITRERAIEMVKQLREVDEVKLTYLGRDYDIAKSKLM